ncbi:MAG: esterase [Firmicutes bacterium]|nr:esterase [Bacillota bacterium]
MDIWEYGDPAADVVLLQPVDGHDLDSMESEIAAIREQTGMDFRLVAFQVANWNQDLSPWNAPALFGKEGFGNGAAETLAAILPYCEERTKTYFIGGYSLAGLFALWAACQTDVFRGVAAASPSLWFPGFTDFLKEHAVKSKRVYLSLGDKEEKTRNPVMATVGKKIGETYALLQAQNVQCVLEWNAGNHFRDADRRKARAFSWLIKGPPEQPEKVRR